jgi:hypothetical protein
MGFLLIRHIEKIEDFFANPQLTLKAKSTLVKVQRSF